MRWASIALVTVWGCTAAEPSAPPRTRVTYSEAYGKADKATAVAADELVRVAPVPPDRAAQTFQIRKGFRIADRKSVV